MKPLASMTIDELRDECQRFRDGWGAQLEATRTAQRERDRLMELRVAERAAAEWRPIETAPKDGTAILAAGQTLIGSNGTFSERYTRICVWLFDGWYYLPPPLAETGGAGLAYKTSPTHWMPLPEPPK